LESEKARLSSEVNTLHREATKAAEDRDRCRQEYSALFKDHQRAGEIVGYIFETRDITPKLVLLSVSLTTKTVLPHDVGPKKRPEF
jgi:hypothetical protein